MVLAVIDMIYNSHMGDVYADDITDEFYKLCILLEKSLYGIHNISLMFENFWINFNWLTFVTIGVINSIITIDMLTANNIAEYYKQRRIIWRNIGFLSAL